MFKVGFAGNTITDITDRITDIADRIADITDRCYTFVRNALTTPLKTDGYCASANSDQRRGNARLCTTGEDSRQSRPHFSIIPIL